MEENVWYVIRWAGYVGVYIIDGGGRSAMLFLLTPHILTGLWFIRTAPSHFLQCICRFQRPNDANLWHCRSDLQFVALHGPHLLQKMGKDSSIQCPTHPQSGPSLGSKPGHGRVLFASNQVDVGEG